MSIQNKVATQSMTKNKRNSSIILMALSAILWSTGGLIIKLIPWHPLAIASARAIIANITILLYMIYLQSKDKKLLHRDRQPLLTLNWHQFFGGVSYSSLALLYVCANKLTTAANTIVLQFTSPIWILIFTAFILKEKVSKENIVSSIFVFAGIILFFIDSIGNGHIFGNLLATTSGLSMAALILFLKHEKTTRPIEITFIGNSITAILGFVFIFSQVFTIQIILYLIFLGVFQIGIAFILYTKAIPHVSSLDAVFIPVLEPILNPIWVLLMTGEKIGLTAIYGSLVILSTILIHNYREAKRLSL